MNVVSLDFSRPLRQADCHQPGSTASILRLRPEYALSNEQLAALIEAVGTERNRDAFARLFEHYSPRLRSFGLKQNVTKAKSEELVQETMLMVWRKAASYDSTKGSPSNWVFTIMRNKRIDMFRRQRHPEYELEEGFDMVDPDPHPDAQVARAQEETVLKTAIQSLPENQAEVIHMAFFEDRSHGEIAETMGLPLGTVKSRIRLAMKRLRILMEEDV